jgi:outer membrane protein assembly factor BamB
VRRDLGGIGLGLLFGAACSPQATLRGASPEVPIWENRPSGSLELVYSRSLVDDSRRVGEAYEVGQPELDVKGRRVFVGSSDRGLYALDATDGGTIWRFETTSFVQCAPLYDETEDVLYFGSHDGALYKIRARDGALLWRFMTNAEVSKRPVLSEGKLYFANANDTVLAVEPATGKLVWSQHRTPAFGMEIASHSGVLVWRGRVYSGFSDGNVVAYDARTGDERWPPIDLTAETEDQAGGDVPQFLDTDTTPVGAELDEGPAVFVGSYAGGVFALDADSGAQIWSNPAVEGVTRLTYWSEPERKDETGEAPRRPATKLLVAASGTTGLWGLDPETGREVWQRRLPASGVTAPVAIQGALLIGASRLGVFLISPKDGGVIDGIHTGDGVSMTPAAFGARAFAVTNGGKLLALTVASPRAPQTP